VPAQLLVHHQGRAPARTRATLCQQRLQGGKALDQFVVARTQEAGHLALDGDEDVLARQRAPAH